MTSTASPEASASRARRRSNLRPRLGQLGASLGEDELDCHRAYVELADEEGEKMEVEISAVAGVSPDSPLGSALLGAKVGDSVDVEAPSGPWKARVLAIRRE